MKMTKVIALASVSGVVLASSLTGTALAWHPKGAIQKLVQNQTANGLASDANDVAHAIIVHTSDVLKYTIEVRNDGAADQSGNNDMAKTVLTDTLPAGIELVSDPAKRVITESLGTLKPGEKVTKTYLVKVTSAKDGDVIENKACFTGDSKVNDNPQNGCNVADVKVVVPPVPTPTPAPAPTPTPQPITPQTLGTATTLPNTGAGNFLLPVGLASAVGYFGFLARAKRRAAAPR